ncbi:M23 family metallopeptidase [Sphingomonas sp. AP4-R1]|uniref:M23 family metallopeptidase n=1 Tax=Sphingomonas sp. AP4-R1 TaxID=2735134 RepID=UPI00149368BA|nr:M23 family metallopeptidase [Sphingomonas sp. AP4-R1]QJU58723.1 M23 family metallopeptidase [Sphingomonas sp. AP4-R1]
MTRTGAWILLFILAVVGGVWWLASRSGPVTEVTAEPASAKSASAAPARLPPSPYAPSRASGLIIPVNGVWQAGLTDTWGDARGDGTREHHAIDIMAPKGTAVVAAAAGTVEKIFESQNGGHTVYVRRTDPAWVDYYAHLDAYAPNLKEGQKLGQGDLIGAVGSTGDASEEAPHLHYEIKRMGPGDKWWQGTEVNPYPLLAR